MYIGSEEHAIYLKQVTSPVCTVSWRIIKFDKKIESEEADSDRANKRERKRERQKSQRKWKTHITHDTQDAWGKCVGDK